MQTTVQQLIVEAQKADLESKAKSAAFDLASKAKDDAALAAKIAAGALNAAESILTAALPANEPYDAGSGQVAIKVDGTVIIKSIHPGTDVVNVPDPAAPPVTTPTA
jgi:hypothetical protein